MPQTRSSGPTQQKTANRSVVVSTGQNGNGNGKVYVEPNKTRAASMSSLWFSHNASKTEGEIFFLKYSAYWVVLVVIIVATRIFEHFTAWSYMAVGLACALPGMLGPLIFASERERRIPFLQRWTTKANIWIWIMSFNANYFWTHYFYQVLGAKYTFIAHRLNDVPICLYFMTHAYFTLYHVGSNLILRRLWNHFGNRTTFISLTVVSIIIGLMSLFTAFGETFTIQNFPYYELADRWAMYTYGSVFYAIYFIISYPMFLRMDENPKEPNWSFSRAMIEGFAVSMLITTGLDFWRLGIGPICEIPATLRSSQAVPFVF